MGVKSESGETGKILPLKPVRDEEAEMAFGVAVRRTPTPSAAANEGIKDLLGRIVVDSSLPLYVAALDGTVLYQNAHYRALDAALGDVTLAAGPRVEGSGVRMPSILPVIDDVRATQETVRAEESARLENGERIFLGRHMPVKNEDGQLIAVAGTYEDVTLQVRGVEEIARTQARFQDFTRASSDWFFECGPDMRVTSLSDRFTAIVGQPAQIFIGSRLDQFGLFETNLHGRLDGLHAIETRKPFRDQLFIVEGDRSHKFRFHLSAVPVFDRKTGDFLGYRGVGMDVDERYRQAEEAESTRVNLEGLLRELTQKNMALDEAGEKAKSALRAKNEFLAAMSHELKTPLNAVIGFAESFTKESFGPLEPRYLDHAKDISQAGKHLLALINDLLDVAVIEGGQVKLSPTEICLEDSAERAVHMVLDSARAKELDTGALSLVGQTWVRADVRRLTQILVNLLSNAVKFTGDHGEIGMDLDINEDTQMAALTVWDTGIGIPDDKHERIFEKFEQVNNGIYSRGQEGTGLGLHISRELARRMGGDITLSSIEGKGSRFRVTLPLADGEADHDDDFI